MSSGLALEKWRRKRQRQLKREEERKAKLRLVPVAEKKKESVSTIAPVKKNPPVASSKKQAPVLLKTNPPSPLKVTTTTTTTTTTPRKKQWPPLGNNNPHSGKQIYIPTARDEEEPSQASSLSTISPPVPSWKRPSPETKKKHSHDNNNNKIIIKKKLNEQTEDDSDAEPDFTTVPVIVKKKKVDLENDKPTPLIVIKKPLVASLQDDDSDAEIDFGMVAPASRNKKNKSATHRYDSDNDDNRSGNGGMSDASSPQRKNSRQRRSIKNPIILERELMEQTAAAAAQQPLASTRSSSMAAENLWSDSEEDQEEESDKKPRAKRKSKKESNDSSGTAEKKRHPSHDEVEDYMEQRRKRKKRKSSNNEPRQQDLHRAQPEEEEESVELEALIPDLENPKFQPSQEHFCPLILTKDERSDDEEDVDNENQPTESTNANAAMTTQHQVPPAVNSCIKAYQREGIQFMYQAFARRQGCILGDDMGLGKTIQILALLSALLGKMGTGRDLVKLRQRRRHLESKLKERRAALEQKLLYGQQDTNETSALEPSQPNDDDEEQLFGPILIIVPPSVVDNWLNEFKTWGHFGVVNFQDSRKREQALASIENGMDEVMITGSGLFQRVEHFRSLLRIPWRLVIVDEFHNYKNYKTIGHQRLQDLKAEHKCLMIGLSGTIMPNEHQELYNLVNLVQPGFLDDWKTFRNYIADPIKLGRTKTATPDAIARGEERKEQLQEKLKPMLLERKKESVQELKKELPMKDEKIVFCKLSPIQKRIYQHIMTLPDFTTLRDARGPCECGVNQNLFREYKRLRNDRERKMFLKINRERIVQRKDCCLPFPKNPIRDTSLPPHHPQAALWAAYHDDLAPCKHCPYCTLLPALQKLYKVCSHAALLQLDRNPVFSEEGSKERLKLTKELEFAKVALPPDVLESLPGGSYIREDSIMDDHKSLSGKMAVLEELLKVCSNKNDRVLIFSYSTKTLGLIENYAKAEGYSFLRIDGGTATSKRQGIVEKFQKDKTIFLFLLSTKACGLGLNITAANVVVVFDVNWNPSLDEQAQDRAYRIGQKRDVQVIRLVSRGTVEELMYIRQIYKVQLKQETLGDAAMAEKQAPNAARLFRGVAGDSSRKGELFGIENLLKYKDGSFMQEIWKTTVSKNGSTRNKVDMHDTRDLSNAISSMTEEDVENIGEPELDETFEKAAAAPDDDDPSPVGNASPSDGEQEVDIIQVVENREAINHEDFLRGDRGEAALQEGDDGFEEEMGGVSQVVHNVMEHADLEAIEDEDDDDESSSVVDGPPDMHASTYQVPLATLSMNPEPILSSSQIPAMGARQLPTIAEDSDDYRYNGETQPIDTNSMPQRKPVKREIAPENLGQVSTATACMHTVAVKEENAEAHHILRQSDQKRVGEGSSDAEATQPLDTPTVAAVNTAGITSSSKDEVVASPNAQEARTHDSAEGTPKAESNSSSNVPAANIRLMGQTHKKVKQSKLKSRFTAADILGM